MNGSQERPERTTLVLTSEINVWLDSQCASMRRTTGTCMSRSELLRAMVRATVEFILPNDFSHCRNAEDIGLMMFIGELGDRPAPTSQGRSV